MMWFPKTFESCATGYLQRQVYWFEVPGVFSLAFETWNRHIVDEAIVFSFIDRHPVIPFEVP